MDKAMGGLKLDLGCGSAKMEGFTGVDRRRFPGVDAVTDLTKKHWLFDQPELGGVKLLPANQDGRSGFILPDSSVAAARSSHFLEHLEHNQAKPERVRFMNELWRVMIDGGEVLIVTPHWASNRAYGDFTHADKPVSEMFYSYLDKAWRAENALDNDIQFNPDGYFCDFVSKVGFVIHPELSQKPAEEVNFALMFYKEAALEMHASLTVRK